MKMTSSDLSTVGLQEYVRDVTSNDLSTVGLQEYVKDVTSSNPLMILASRNMSGMWTQMIFPRFGFQEKSGMWALVNFLGEYRTRKPQGVATPQLLVPMLSTLPRLWTP